MKEAEAIEAVEQLRADSKELARRARIYEAALRRICTAGPCVPGDPLDDAYLRAGGGSGGLQAIAQTALEATGQR